MNKYLMLFAALLCAFMMGCKPEPEPSSSWSHTFGDLTNMHVTDFDTTLWNECLDVLAYDVDDDGQPDIQFSGYYDGPNMMSILKLYAECLNPNVEWMGDDVTREHYYFRFDTTYTYTFEDEVEIIPYTKQYYACSQINENFTMTGTTEEYEIRANLAGDSFDDNASFNNQEITLYTDGYGIEGKSMNDTIVTPHYYTYHFNDCGRFPMDRPYYIGFRLTSGETHRYGWILLKLNDHPEKCFNIRQLAIEE